MENVRKYRNVKFESNPFKVRKLISSPFYDECEIIEESTNTIESEASAGSEESSGTVNKVNAGGLGSPVDYKVSETSIGIVNI